MDIAQLAVRLTRLEDERDVRRALERYGHSLDYGLEAEWVDSFTADGIYEMRMKESPADAAQVFPFAEVSPTAVRFAGREALARCAALMVAGASPNASWSSNPTPCSRRHDPRVRRQVSERTKL